MSMWSLFSSLSMWSGKRPLISRFRTWTGSIRSASAVSSLRRGKGTTSPRREGERQSSTRGKPTSEGRCRRRHIRSRFCFSDLVQKRRTKSAAGRRPFRLVDFTTEEKGFHVGRYVLRYIQTRRNRAFTTVSSPHVKIDNCYSRQQTDHESFGDNNFSCPPYRLVTALHNIVKQIDTTSLKRMMYGGAEEEALESAEHDPYSIDAMQDALHDLQHHITEGQYSAAIERALYNSGWRKAFIKTPKIE